MLSDKEIKYLLEKYKTREKGLTTEEVKKRLKENGLNEIKGKKRKSLIVMFFKEFADLMVIILIVASVLALIGNEVADAIVILFIIILNAFIGFIQKFKAEKAVEALKKMIAPVAHVIRDGKQLEIDSKELVIGDILILKEGDSISADAILIESNELKTMEATLTGESNPTKKDVIEDKNIKVISTDKKNMVYMGTTVSNGNGKAIVVATGMKTQMGNIAKLTSETKKEKSPLEKELLKIGLFVGKIAFGISAVLLFVGVFIHGKPFIDTLLFASAVAVAAVPEGLPATITIALAIGVQRLSKQNAIVKQLSSVETLGSTTVICSDKTGTLTKNEMTVKEIYFDNYKGTIEDVGYAPIGEIKIMKDNKNISKKEEYKESLNLLMECAYICNNASLQEKNSEWKIIGDPTEGALITMARKAGIKKIENKYTKIKELSFDSKRKLMTVIVKSNSGKYFAFTKGAPDTVLEICTNKIENGKTKLLTKKHKEEITQNNILMAEKALRVLSFAYKEISKSEYEKLIKNSSNFKNTEKDMTFIGLSGMIDPPRPEVKNAVKLAKKANIRIIIITGDFGITAEAIAKQLGIIKTNSKYKIITGNELNEIEESKLRKILKDEKTEIIFARVSPEHKLRIVETLKQLNEIVAVTGDGVNDAPALKKADIGIAMGITGTDVSKEASNMVLADDSFSTIITAIKEGRTIYDNLKKFVFFIFSCNIGELLTIFMALLLAMPAPLSAILILIVNLGTDILPAVALGVDPSEPGIMEKKPRDPNDHLINTKFVLRFLYIGILIGIIVIGVYLWSLYSNGWKWGEELSDEHFIHIKASTMAFVSLVIIQMVNVFNARSEKHSIIKLKVFSNLWLIGAVTSSIILTILITEIPLLQNYIGTTSLTIKEWGIIIGSSMIILLVEEFRKLIIRVKEGKRKVQIIN